MIKRKERKEDLIREEKAIETFVNLFEGSYKKLGPNDIDFRIHDKEGKLIGYVEVKGRMREIADAYPLPVAARKIVKLCDKKLHPILIWACVDGIIWGKVERITGSAYIAGKEDKFDLKKRELMVYFHEQPNLRTIWY